MCFEFRLASPPSRVNSLSPKAACEAWSSWDSQMLPGCRGRVLFFDNSVLLFKSHPSVRGSGPGTDLPCSVGGPTQPNLFVACTMRSAHRLERRRKLFWSLPWISSVGRECNDYRSEQCPAGTPHPHLSVRLRVYAACFDRTRRHPFRSADRMVSKMEQCFMFA